MFDSDEKQDKQSGPWAAVVGLLFLAGYPLSLGPAVWLQAHDYVPGEVLGVIYAPLSWLVQRSVWLQEVFTAYVRWWLDTFP